MAIAKLFALHANANYSLEDFIKYKWKCQIRNVRITVLKN